MFSIYTVATSHTRPVSICQVAGALRNRILHFILIIFKLPHAASSYCIGWHSSRHLKCYCQSTYLDFRISHFSEAFFLSFFSPTLFLPLFTGFSCVFILSHCLSVYCSFISFFWNDVRQKHMSNPFRIRGQDRQKEEGCTWGENSVQLRLHILSTCWLQGCATRLGRQGVNMLYGHYLFNVFFPSPPPNGKLHEGSGEGFDLE